MLDHSRHVGVGGQGMEEGAVNTPVHGPGERMGYHRRAGGHDVLSYDWDQYLKFAELHFGKPTAGSRL